MAPKKNKKGNKNPNTTLGGGAVSAAAGGTSDSAKRDSEAREEEARAKALAEARAKALAEAQRLVLAGAGEGSSAAPRAAEVAHSAEPSATKPKKGRFPITEDGRIVFINDHPGLIDGFNEGFYRSGFDKIECLNEFSAGFPREKLREKLRALTALIRNPLITRIDLKEEELGSEGLKSILQAISGNKKIKDISLDVKIKDDQTVDELIKIFNERPLLTDLKISFDPSYENLDKINLLFREALKLGIPKLTKPERFVFIITDGAKSILDKQKDFRSLVGRYDRLKVDIEVFNKVAPRHVRQITIKDFNNSNRVEIGGIAKPYERTDGDLGVQARRIINMLQNIERDEKEKFSPVVVASAGAGAGAGVGSEPSSEELRSRLQLISEDRHNPEISLNFKVKDDFVIDKLIEIIHERPRLTKLNISFDPSYENLDKINLLFKAILDKFKSTGEVVDFEINPKTGPISEKQENFKYLMDKYINLQVDINGHNAVPSAPQIGYSAVYFIFNAKDRESFAASVRGSRKHLPVGEETSNDNKIAIQLQKIISTLEDPKINAYEAAFSSVTAVRTGVGAPSSSLTPAGSAPLSSPTAGLTAPR